VKFQYDVRELISCYNCCAKGENKGITRQIDSFPEVSMKETPNKKEKRKIARGERGDPFCTMPLELMMLVEVRCDALLKYRALDGKGRRLADDMARSAANREEKERVIDAVERGDFG